MNNKHRRRRNYCYQKKGGITSMLRYLPVRKIHARQVLDSRGNPTVEVEVTVGEGIVGIN